MIKLMSVLIVAIAAWPTPVLAKGETKKISIAGDTPASAIVITDPAILNHVNVWSGPGTSGSIHGVKWKATGDKGYVYFPGRNDPHWRTNVFLILRETEGRWYEASRAWRDAVNWFVLVLSTAVTKSKWVKHELLYALEHNAYKSRILAGRAV